MKWVIGILIMLMGLVPVYGDTGVLCLNSTTQQSQTEFNIDNDMINFEVTEACPFGCSNDFQRCKPAPFKANLIGFGLIIGLSMFMAFIISKVQSIQDILFPLLAITPMLFATMGFIDIYSNGMRILFAILTILSILLIIIVASVMKKDQRLRK